MGRTKLFVEDANDKHTFEAIIQHLSFHDKLDVTEIDWETRPAEANPDKPTGLINAFKSLALKIEKNNEDNFDKIGVIWDWDVMLESDRLKMINRAIREGFSTAEVTEIESVGQFGEIIFNKGKRRELSIKVSCHFVGLNGKGEIEDLLKAIASKPAPLADCINKHLPDCLKEQKIEDLRDKDLVKLWINNYQRFDTLAKDKRTAHYTSWENMMKKRSDIFNFDADVAEMRALKDFLTKMVESAAE